MVSSNCDFPQIIINSIPAPELVFNYPKEEDLVDYIEGLEFLENSEVDFIVMICNTIHLFRDRLQKYVNAPIIDIRKLMRRYLWQSWI